MPIKQVHKHYLTLKKKKKIKTTPFFLLVQVGTIENLDPIKFYDPTDQSGCPKLPPIDLNAVWIRLNRKRGFSIWRTLILSHNLSPESWERGEVMQKVPISSGRINCRTQRWLVKKVRL